MLHFQRFPSTFGRVDAVYPVIGASDHAGGRVDRRQQNFIYFYKFTLLIVDSFNETPDPSAGKGKASAGGSYVNSSNV